MAENKKTLSHKGQRTSPYHINTEDYTYEQLMDLAKLKPLHTTHVEAPVDSYMGTTPIQAAPLKFYRDMTGNYIANPNASTTTGGETVYTQTQDDPTAVTLYADGQARRGGIKKIPGKIPVKIPTDSITPDPIRNDNTSTSGSYNPGNITQGTYPGIESPIPAPPGYKGRKAVKRTIQDGSGQIKEIWVDETTGEFLGRVEPQPNPSGSYPIKKQGGKLHYANFFN